MVITLNSILELAGKLGSEENDMLVDILQKRRVDAHRKELAAYARKARRDVSAGKLKPEPLSDMLKRLHRLADQEP